MENQARLASTPLTWLRKLLGRPLSLLQEVVPVAAVVAAGAEVGGDPENLVDVADRGRDLVDQALVFQQHHFGFAVGIVVVFPALGLLVVLEHAAAPDRVVDLVLRGTDGVGPDLVHRACCVR